MKTVIFKKIERVCPHNTKIREKGEKRGIIYDYEIWENGEKKGTFEKQSFSMRYWLVDSASYPVKNEVNISGQASLKDFATVYKDYKRYIPTVEQIAEREAKKQREREAEEESQRQDHIKYQKEFAAPEMYEALKHMLYIFDKGFEAGTDRYIVCKEAKQAIAKGRRKKND